ncbi:hypothetical protein HG536_0G00830 [Torulaspora globosa]|uniref:Endoplasmic reticulum transmembrane protein n=1 Tax=Torulaspora globosa TaxID=48254 RepID=A0A7G3ZL40_9SACH|nr:uncharacterized protein HG536_0G00830 [Torulaspora globosa]QLL34226.1 hypothetical protein HG536_0G00830 [Torulaspora globosa]
MSLYFTSLFAVLTFEMVLLFIIVLPLPYRMRKFLYNTYYKWTSSKQFQTVYYIFGIIVGLLFVDSWKRAQVKVSLYHHRKYNEENPDPAAVTPIQALASRAYNQRNVYISGFILYFMICIPTVMTIVRRLVKYENLIREEKADRPKDAKLGRPVEDRDIDELAEKLKNREASLRGLQKQVKNLEEFFDKQNDEKALGRADEKIKKNV